VTLNENIDLTFNTNLAHVILGEILQFGHVHQFDQTVGQQSPDMAGVGVVGQGAANRGRHFGLAIGLDEYRSERAPDELLHLQGHTLGAHFETSSVAPHLGQDRRRSGDHKPDIAAQALLDLLQHQLVPNRVPTNDALSQHLHFSVHGQVEQAPRQEIACRDLIFDAVDQFIQETGYYDKKARFEHLSNEKRISDIRLGTSMLYLHVRG